MAGSGLWLDQEFCVLRLASAPVALASRGAKWQGVNAACPRLGDVQARVDRITKDVQRDHIGLSSTQFGTEVHTRLKNEINNLHEPDFRSEVSFLKSRATDRYGQMGSVRVDVLEQVNSRTVCVYDIKTGASGLTLPRMVEIAGRVYATFGRVAARIIVTEVRPR